MSGQPPWDGQPLASAEASAAGQEDAARLARAVQSSPDVLASLNRMAEGGLSGQEAAMAAVIGLAGAFLSGQLTPAEAAPTGAPVAGAPSASQAAAGALQGSEGAQLATLASPENLEVARQAGLTHVGSAIGVDLKSAVAKASGVSLGDLAKGLDLDAPDLLAGGATGLMLRALGARLGWSDDPVRQHQAAFVAYATQFLVSLKFNPNPVVAGLAFRHAFKLLKAERKLMDELVKAWDALLAAGEQTRATYARALAASADIDRWAAALTKPGGRSPAEDLF